MATGVSPTNPEAEEAERPKSGGTDGRCSIQVPACAAASIMLCTAVNCRVRCCAAHVSIVTPR